MQVAWDSGLPAEPNQCVVGTFFFQRLLGTSPKRSQLNRHSLSWWTNIYRPCVNLTRLVRVSFTGACPCVVVFLLWPVQRKLFPVLALTFSLPLDLTCLLSLLLSRRLASHVQTRQSSSGSKYSSAISSRLDSSSFPASEAGEIAGTSARSKGYSRCLLPDSRKLAVCPCCLQGCS